MADKYSNFEDLAEFNKEGEDYSIKFSDRNSDVLILGPHAGAIEPGTSEIVLAIAGNDLSFYLFEGIKDSGNAELHITSTNFDEPQARSMTSKSKTVLAIHGERAEEEIVYLGDRNQAILSQIHTVLQDADYMTGMHENPGLQGTSPQNICNRCRSSEGVQLELSRGLRNTFFESLTSQGRKRKTPKLEKFANVIRLGLANARAI